jgi:3' terminal RNA ribose 2'-O-methyltransferase Hen1
MLLTITTTHRPATDLGFLLHKNPGAVRSEALSFGTGHVFYPQATEERCTAALMLEIDPIRLVRAHSGEASSLAEYVNDRPFVASSFISVAMSKLFGTALSGRSKERPELAAMPIPLEFGIPAVPARGGEDMVRRLFEPLGYAVTAGAIQLDPAFPDWGASRYLAVTLSAVLPLSEALNHLYVLLPVLDDDKHYWVGRDEIDKLLRRGENWLADHPERELITGRYLRHQRPLTREALARLLEEDQGDPDRDQAERDREEGSMEQRIDLAEQRIGSVIAAIRAAGARRILDLGCGEGRLTRALLKEPSVEKVVGVDVSIRALATAARRLHLDTMAPMQRARVELLQSSLTYRDKRLGGFDAAAVMEVVEHLSLARLGAFEQALFKHARPRSVVMTTPNVEYNVRFEGLPAGQLRHRDHRFEWSRAEFRAWASEVAGRRSYDVRFLPVGPDDPEVGSPTQMAVFRR